MAELTIQQVADHVRNVCIRTAIQAHEDAAMDGLCPQGAWECALDALRSMNVEQLLQDMTGDQISIR